MTTGRINQVAAFQGRPVPRGDPNTPKRQKPSRADVDYLNRTFPDRPMGLQGRRAPALSPFSQGPSVGPPSSDA